MVRPFYGGVLNELRLNDIYLYIYVKIHYDEV